MEVPKCKVSKARRNSRNSANFKASTPTLVECPQCHAHKAPHKVCPTCGYYNGKQVVNMDKKDSESK